MMGGVATLSLYTILHLICQMKYDVMWLRVLLMVSMEDFLSVIVQSQDLLKDCMVTGEEFPVLLHHSLKTMLRTSLAHLQP